MLDKTIGMVKETLERVIQTAVAVKVTDERMKEVVQKQDDHERRIAKLEATSDLNVQKVKVAFLEAKEQLRLGSSRKKQ